MTWWLWKLCAWPLFRVACYLVALVVTLLWLLSHEHSQRR